MKMYQVDIYGMYGGVLKTKNFLDFNQAIKFAWEHPRTQAYLKDSVYGDFELFQDEFPTLEAFLQNEKQQFIDSGIIEDVCSYIETEVL